MVLGAVSITTFPRRRAHIKPAPVAMAAGLLLGFVAALSAVVSTEPRLALPGSEITTLRGRLVWDSARVGSDEAYVIRLIDCGSEELTASAGGRVRVRANSGVRAYWGDSVVCTGVVQGTNDVWYADNVITDRRATGLRALRNASHRALVPSDRAASNSAAERGEVGGGGGSARSPGSALFIALTTGVRDDLDPELVELFRRSGCSHILALSGMHLGILCAIPIVLLRRRIGPRKAAAAATLFALVYVLFVGPKPSLLRAVAMYAVSVAFFLRDVRVDPLSILSIAFCILLFAVPHLANELSFQLSFLALAGILAATPMCARFMSRWLPPGLASGVSAAIGAQAMTSGLVASTFGTLYPIGILASVALMPLVVVHLLSGALDLAVPMLSLADHTHDLILGAARLTARAPSVSVEPAVGWALALIPIAVWAATALRSRR